MKDYNVKNAWRWWGYSKWLQRSDPSPRLFAKCLSHSRGVQVLSNMFSVSRIGGIWKVNSIIQHTTKQKWILIVPRGATPGCQREPAFGGLDPTTICRLVVHAGARFCHSRLCERGGNSLKDICHFHVSISAVCCVVFFAVIRTAEHAGSRCSRGEGVCQHERWNFYSMVCLKCCTAKKKKISSY